MVTYLIYLIVFGIILISLFGFINSQFTQSSTKPKNTKSTKNPAPIKTHKTDITELYKDIHLESYGCFTSLDEKFFTKQINDETVDSGTIISNQAELKQLIKRVIDNGFDIYGYKMMYKDDISLIEIGILGKLAGYNFLSTYTLDKTKFGKFYLTYSPPMNNDLDINVSDEEYNKNISKGNGYTVTPKLNNYTNIDENAPGKELSCGYPCLSKGNPITFDEKGEIKQYMCGSVGFPNIKSPVQFAVYRISEK